ncbi:MAG: excalibur calcium-binding domain-containing protein [Meiothermus sp.]|nr:excalibur calcium-binding domain-containing protein [Meiothermus sp.]
MKTFTHLLPVWFLLALFVSGVAYGQRMYIGVASVVDGDTLEIQGTRIRLSGLDAPEAAQLCVNSQGQRFRCGAQVANALAAFLARRTVTCRQRGTDRYGRVLATCVVAPAGETVGGWLVSKGYAFIDPRFASDYRTRQVQASRSRAGLWAGRFQNPWEWRRLGASAPWQGRAIRAVQPRPPQPSRPSSVYYPSCAAARAAGAAPVRVGEPGYRPGLDRDGDGVACE